MKNLSNTTAGYTDKVITSNKMVIGINTIEKLVAEYHGVIGGSFGLGLSTSESDIDVFFTDRGNYDRFLLKMSSMVSEKRTVEICYEGYRDLIEKISIQKSTLARKVDINLVGTILSKEEQMGLHYQKHPNKKRVTDTLKGGIAQTTI